MKRSSLISLFCLWSVFVFGQRMESNKKSIFIELAGSGGLGSLNYESHFYKKNNLVLTWRAGLSFAPIDKNNGVGIVFPVMMNGLLGRTPHKIEVGLGQGITVTTRGSFFALTTGVLGYRFQQESKNWFYRVSYTPLISYLVDFQVQHWGGFSIGYTFKTN